MLNKVSIELKLRKNLKLLPRGTVEVIHRISRNRAIYTTLKIDFIAQDHFPKKSFGDLEEQL